MIKGQVSVILPFYNGKAYIKETIDSLHAQTYPNYEVLLIDDGSPKQEESQYAADLISSLHDPRFVYVWKANGGLSDARNFGIARSEGEFIAFVDQDDLWMPTKLEDQIRMVERHPEAQVVFTDGAYIGERNHPIGMGRRYRLPDGEVPDTYTRLLRRNFVLTISMLIRKQLIDRAGAANRYFLTSPDYEYTLRLARLCDFHYLDKPLIGYRLHAANTTKNRLRLYGEDLIIMSMQDPKNFKGRILLAIHALKLVLYYSGCFVKRFWL